MVTSLMADEKTPPVIPAGCDDKTEKQRHSCGSGKKKAIEKEINMISELWPIR